MKRTVAIPEATALELRTLIDRAIQAADQAEQKGAPLPHAQYQRMCWLYADLDQAIDGHKDHPTRYPHIHGVKPR